MKKYLKFVTTLTLLSMLGFFSACGGATAQPKAQNTLPSWYLNPAPTIPSTYFSVGEGSTKNEAKLNALNIIAGEISTSISSTTQSNAKSTLSNDGESVSKEFKVNIKASVEKIKFTSAKVIANAYNNGTFYAYVSVDREILFKTLKKDVDLKFNKITSLWDYIKSHGAFEVFKNSKQLNKYINSILPKLSILKAVNGSFDQASYISQLENIQNQAREAKSHALVYVKDVHATPYANLVKKYLSSNNMNLVSSIASAHNSADLIIVEVSFDAKEKQVKTSDPRLRGASFADVKVTVTTKNPQGKIIARNIIPVMNISKEGYAAATIKTAKFEREVKKKGILNILLEAPKK